jgi:hypothetical protein
MSTPHSGDFTRMAADGTRPVVIWTEEPLTPARFLIAVSQIFSDRRIRKVSIE